VELLFSHTNNEILQFVAMQLELEDIALS
jgi:hypothetical protein